ncbi:phenylglyoxylate dehydrogenase [Chloroflexota bacterium]
MIAKQKQVKALDGNKAAAHGVLLCKPDVVSVYPITPQTPLPEELWRFSSEGLLEAETVEAEGEMSVMSALIGASAAGGRTFGATSGSGLAFMFEAYCQSAPLRLPIVMAIATREMIGPSCVLAGEQDVFSVRDVGWIHIHCETCQEILDSIIMAYKLAEDPDILLPVNICYDGYYLSHATELVNIPLQEDVDNFLGPRKERLTVKPDVHMYFGTADPTLRFAEYRYKHIAALERSKGKIEDIDCEFQHSFGRSYGGLIERYRMDDADVALVALGSCAGTAKVVIDAQREAGVKAGLIRLRSVRPFPKEILRESLKGVKGIGVIDRNICFGFNTGTVFMELKAALYDLVPLKPMANLIIGIGGSDITIERIKKALEITSRAANGQPFEEVTWLDLE